MVLVVVVHVVPDGVQQVGLAEAGRAVDEQRVVAATRCFGHPQGGRERELVRRTLHEGLEGVPRVQAGEVERLTPGRRHTAAASVVSLVAFVSLTSIETILAIAITALDAIAVVHPFGSLRAVGTVAPVGTAVVVAAPVPSVSIAPPISRVSRITSVAMIAIVLSDPTGVAVEVERFDELYFDHQLATGDPDLLHRVAHERQVARQDAVAGVAVGRAQSQQARIRVECDDVLERREPHGFRHLRAEDLRDRCPHLIRVAHLHLLRRRRITVHIVVHNCGRPPVPRPIPCGKRAPPALTPRRRGALTCCLRAVFVLSSCWQQVQGGVRTLTGVRASSERAPRRVERRECVSSCASGLVPRVRDAIRTRRPGTTVLPDEGPAPNLCKFSSLVVGARAPVRSPARPPLEASAAASAGS